MYVSMYVCMYVCMYVYMYVCIYVCIRIYICFYVYMPPSQGLGMAANCQHQGFSDPPFCSPKAKCLGSEQKRPHLPQTPIFGPRKWGLGQKMDLGFEGSNNGQEGMSLGPSSGVCRASGKGFEEAKSRGGRHEFEPFRYSPDTPLIRP